MTNRAAAAKLWSWFEKFEDELFRGLMLPEQSEQTLGTLNAALRLVDESLSFEVGSLRDGKRELILTANGVRESIPAIGQLLEQQPACERFTFSALRQRKALDSFTACSGETRLLPAHVRFTLTENRRLFDVAFFVPDYSEAKHYACLDLCYSLLDAAIGEFDVATKIGDVTVQKLVNAEDNSAVCFLEFPEKMQEAEHFLVNSLSQQTDETRRETLLHRHIGLLPQRIEALSAQKQPDLAQMSVEFYFITSSASAASSLTSDLEQSGSCVAFSDTANSVLGEVHSVTCYVDVPLAEAHSLPDMIVHMAERAASCRASLEDVSLAPAVPPTLDLF